jgi:RimJ/RimL family protein N-acetyltransferase
MGVERDMMWAAEHRRGGEVLRAIEPAPDEVRGVSAVVASFYNDPHNRRMMANTVDLSPEDVVASFAELRANGGRPFLLYAGERLVGDGDLRHLHVRAGAGEVAVLVGDRANHGRGLGTRFTALLHAFGFQILGLERIYASILPENEPSLRLFAKLGHAPDASETARSFADEPGDVTLSVARATFESAASVLLADVRLSPR